MSEHDPEVIESARQRDLLNDGNPVQRLMMLADAHPETWGRLDAASLIGERKADTGTAKRTSSPAPTAPRTPTTAEVRAVAEFTERQAKAWADDVTPILKRHGIYENPHSHGWVLDWSDETRPGRGRYLNAQFIDGEHYAQVLMDVYGYPNVSVALLTWIHADSDEELVCEDCPKEATDGR